VELATRSRYAREHARVLVSFLQRQEKWKLGAVPDGSCTGPPRASKRHFSAAEGIAPIMVTFIICKQKLRGTLYADGAGWLVNQEKVEMWESGRQSRPTSARYR